MMAEASGKAPARRGVSLLPAEGASHGRGSQLCAIWKTGELTSLPSPAGYFLTEITCSNKFKIDTFQYRQAKGEIKRLQRC